MDLQEVPEEELVAELARRQRAQREDPEARIKRMDPREFRDAGYLQELNRRFLHPLGLALEVAVYDNDVWAIGGVWDYRDDPEGINYGKADDEQHQAMLNNVAYIDMQWIARQRKRVEGLGYFVQPPDTF